MKKYIIPLLLSISIFFYIQSLNAISEDQKDYDPGIPKSWFLEDGSFGE